ncbi:MAG TPA: glycosyltransferase family 2 protein [Dehalococcoidales bacterium]|nr:glycosyltransferase family 2 protein [Dehalococcoidales bacterium]
MAELTNPRVVVAMPAYNEERYIGTLVLKARKYTDEVMVIDDGSTDGTAEISRLAGAKVISHSKNKGKGVAVQSILREVKKKIPDVLVLLDADSQHNPDEIPRLIKPVLEGYDLVIGSRKDTKKSIPFYRRIGQKILLHSTRILARNRISDSESGFRAFSRRAIAELKLSQKGFAIESEMIADAEEKGLKITEVPISVKYTKDGSTLNPIRHGLGVITQIMVMISERKPLFFFGILGGILTIAGFIAGIRTLEILRDVGVLPIGTVMLTVLFFIVGVFCIFTGIILHTLSRRR